MNFKTPPIFKGLLDNWKHDWKNDQRLFWLETIGTLGCVIAAVILALTAPAPKLLYVYSAYMVGSCSLMTAAYIRNNGWWVCLNAFFLLFDTIGLYKVLSA